MRSSYNCKIDSIHQNDSVVATRARAVATTRVRQCNKPIISLLLENFSLRSKHLVPDYFCSTHKCPDFHLWRIGPNFWGNKHFLATSILANLTKLSRGGDPTIQVWWESDATLIFYHAFNHLDNKDGYLRGEKRNYKSVAKEISKPPFVCLLKSSGHQSLSCLFDSRFL